MSLLRIIVVLALWMLLRWYRLSACKLSIRGDVLLVFAHPDDEAMFFTPLLHHLQSRGIGAHFLCLSNGNFDGKGKLREAELYASGQYFGIPSRNIKIVQHPELQDGMGNVWPLEVIRREIDQYLQTSGRISTVVTFDRFGVSAHPNHCAVHNGALLVKENMPPGIIFLQLRTRNLVSKYIGPMSLLWYLALAQHDGGRYNFATMIPPAHVARSMRAMCCHPSQLVWFRYLYVVFSSYTYLGEYEELS